MYQGLQHAHSGLRWVVLVMLIWAIVNAATKLNKKDYTAGDRKIGLFALISTHIQVLLGLALYSMSPLVSFGDGWMKNAASRFYGMEHIMMMLLAAVLITIGYSTAKRAVTANSKFKKTLIFYLLGLLLILSAIPWPFREGLGGGWF